jgi:hypothetical protein
VRLLRFFAVVVFVGASYWWVDSFQDWLLGGQPETFEKKSEQIVAPIPSEQVLGVSDESGQVKAATTPSNENSLVFRVRTVFEDSVEFVQGVAIDTFQVAGEFLVDGTARIGGNLIVDEGYTLSADNVVYSLTAGENVILSGDQDLTVSFDATSINQGLNYFSIFDFGDDITADGKADTISFASGTGISYSVSGNEVTIAANAADLNVSGWTDGGTSVVLGTTTDNVGIGTSTASYKLDVNGELNLTDAIRFNGDAGTSGYLLTSSGGGAPTWSDPNNLNVGWWSNVLGVISPRNEYATVTDLVLGGTATSSASIHLRSDGYGKFGDIEIYNDSEENTFLGKSAGSSNTATGGLNGIYNTFLGSLAGSQNTTGNRNNAIGYGALENSQTGNYNTANGYRALNSNTDGNSNTAIGSEALADNTSGYYNTALGDSAMYSNLTGTWNVALGPFALDEATSSTYNIAIGRDSIGGDGNGFANIAIGRDTLKGFSGYVENNIAIGYRSQSSSSQTGSSNISVGGYTLDELTSGEFNIVTGDFAGTKITSGNTNTIYGYVSGYNLTSGSNNVLYGYSSGDNLITGSNNIMIGYDIDAPSATSDNQLNIGNIIYGIDIDGTGTAVSTGNIGIGSTDPTQKLDVAGDGVYSGHLGLGGQSPDSSNVLYIDKTFSTGSAGVHNSGVKTYIDETNDSATGTITGGRFKGEYSANGSLSAITGILGYGYNNGPGTVAYVFGGTSIADTKGGTTSAEQYGFLGSSKLTTTSTLPVSTAIQGQLRNQSTGTITNARVLDTYFENTNAGGTVTNLYGLDVGGTWGTNAGTVTNSYGIYLDSNIDIGTNNRYAIYSESASKSYFAGNIGIGTVNPTQALDVDGNIHMPFTLTDASKGVLSIGGMRLHTYGSSTLNPNIFVGTDAGNFTNTGSNNLALGTNTLLGDLTSGSYNIAMGNASLSSVTSEYGNIAIGDQARSSARGNSNVALGNSAGQVADGDYNVNIGEYSGGSLDGEGNTTIGAFAGGWSSSGDYLTFIGSEAGRASSNYYTKSTAIGYNAKVGASNALVLGGTGVDAVNVGIGLTTPGYELDVVGEFNLTDAIRVAGNAGTSGYLLTSSGGGANTWTDPNSIVRWFENTGNVLHPRNEYAAVADLALGGTSSASANIHFKSNGQAYFSEELAIHGASLNSSYGLNIGSLSGGERGINITSSAPASQVYGTYFNVDNPGSSGANFGMYASQTGSTGISDFVGMYVSTDGGKAQGLYTDLTIGTGAYGYGSRHNLNGISAQITGVSNNLTGNNSNLRGVTNYISASGTGTGLGVYNIMSTTSDAIAQTGYANYSLLNTYAGAADVIYGSYIVDGGLSTGGTQTGLYVDLDDADVTNYSIYVENGSGISYFGSNVGVGTTGPTQKLHISSGNIQIDDTTNANTNGVIYKGSVPFIHNFNYGNNGTTTTTGNNLFIGENAGNFTTGSTATLSYESSYNTFIGAYSGNSITKGRSNTALGSNALRNITTGGDNNAVGTGSLYLNTTGNSNATIGHNSLYNNSSGSRNAVIGASALNRSITGSDNVALGYSAGYYIADGVTYNTTSDDSVYIGANTRPLADNDQNEIVIGNDAIGVGSNSVVLGNDSISKTILKGNVGIGTTSPSERLHVYDTTGKTASTYDQTGTGNLVVTSAYGAKTVGTGAAISFAAPANTDGSNIYDMGRILATPDNTTNNDAFSRMYLQTRYFDGGGWDYVNNLVLSGTGNVGIGSTNPTQRLDVSGSARFSSVSSGTYANDLNLTSNGTLTTSSSDRRLKTNIVGLNNESILDGILSLKPSKFNWIDGNKSDIGLIAQEVSQVFPEITFTNEVDGYMGINYSRLPALLVSAIQEQQLQIDSLSLSITEDGSVLGIEELEEVTQADEVANNPATVEEMYNQLLEIQEEQNNRSEAVSISELTIQLLRELRVTAQAVFEDTVEYLATVTFREDVIVEGKLELSKDQVGRATITQGNDAVYVDFETDYESDPIITLTPASDYSVDSYYVTDVTTSGFVIKVSEVLGSDEQIVFNWHSFVGRDIVETISPEIELEEPVGEVAGESNVIESTDSAQIDTEIISEEDSATDSAQSN